MRVKMCALLFLLLAVGHGPASFIKLCSSVQAKQSSSAQSSQINFESGLRIAYLQFWQGGQRFLQHLPAFGSYFFFCFARAALMFLLSAHKFMAIFFQK